MRDIIFGKAKEGRGRTVNVVGVFMQKQPS